MSATRSEIVRDGDLQGILSRSHLPGLDGLRAVSIALVLFSHGGLGEGASSGVNAFFVISGFLITHLLLKEHARTSDISLRDFYLRRALRIFPAYYVFLLLSLGIDFFQGDPRSRADALAAAFYLQNYRNAIVGHSSSSIAHSWSLAVEEQFYLLWPAVLLGLLFVDRERVWRVLVLVIAAVLAWRSVAYLALGLGQSWAYNAFDCRFDSLAVGCLLAAGLRSNAFAQRVAAFTRAWWQPAVTVSLIALPTFIAPGWWKYTVGFTYEAALVALLIAQLLVWSGSGFWSWLEWPAVRYVGTVSYSLYLYHNWGLGLGDNFAEMPAGMQFVIGCVAGLLLASCSYWFVEKPFLRLKDRIGHRHLPPTVKV